MCSRTFEGQDALRLDELLLNTALGFVVPQSCTLLSVFSVRTSAIILTCLLAQENAPQPYVTRSIIEITTLCAESKLIPAQLDLCRHAENSKLDALQGSQINDDENVDCERELPGRYTWSGRGEISTNSRSVHARVVMTRSLVENIEGISAKSKTALGKREAEARPCSYPERNLLCRSG